MTRGPQPVRARDESLPIARRRGLVQRYQHRRGNVCDFSIMSPGLVSFVCVMRLVRLSSTTGDILHDYATVIGTLRFIASSLAISRELWLQTPHGAWRFFRILDDGILQLGPDGLALANGMGPVKDISTATSAGMVTRPQAALHSRQKSITSGPDMSGKKTVPGNNSPPGPSGNPEKDPAPVFNPTNNPVPDSAAKTAPAPSPAPENNPVPATAPEDAPPPGINLELIRRFMRWRKERQKKRPGSG